MFVRLAATSLLVVGTLGTTADGTAQRPCVFPDVCLVLTFPAPTLEAMKVEFGRGGVSWDLIRRNGLTLTVEGQGDANVSVVALVVAQGRVTRVWSSPARTQVRPGTVTLSGREFIPDDRFLQGLSSALGEQAGTTVSVADATRAIEGRSVSPLLDSRIAASASGVILIAVPDSTSRTATSSRTSPRFVRTEVTAN